MEHEYEIWSEGYQMTGDSSPALLHGEAVGVDFKAACIAFARTNFEFNRYFDAATNYYWACELFDNEVDARKAFG